ncbi:MAG TPA: hypothetical protein VGC91_03150 [Pyrinomonadaceae bacterium]|jgi:hypothetical protein
MKTFNCFIIFPSDQEEVESQLIPDNKRGLIEKPSGCMQFDGQAVEVDFNQVYTYIIKPALDEVEKQCGVKIERLRGVDIQQAGDIFDQLLPHICNADITITDLTTSNPNVFLEYGIRSSVKDRLNIIIAHEPFKRPFNINGLTYIGYKLGDFRSAAQATQSLFTLVKSHIEPKNNNTNMQNNERIKRNVDLYSGRRREQEVIKAFEPAPQLIADLAGFLLKHGKEPLLKQKSIKFLDAVGAMLEKDERGLERAIAHYLMMCQIEGLSKDKLEELYVRLSELYDTNPETQEKAAEYRKKAEDLGEQ